MSVSHDKSVDSPQALRGLRLNPHADKQSENSFHIGGDAVDSQEPAWGSTQRYQARGGDHSGMLRHEAGESRPSSSRRERSTFDPAENRDWTQDTGSTVQKVVQEAATHEKMERGDEWSSSSCAKTLGSGDSPKKHFVIERGDKTIPNEKPRRDPHAFVSGWNHDSQKTISEQKRVLDLCPAAPAPAAPKSTARKEDWDSNLKTLPNCARGVQRIPHVYDDIKDSVVEQPARSPIRQF